jgi:hypothetical protein
MIAQSTGLVPRAWIAQRMPLANPPRCSRRDAATALSEPSAVRLRRPLESMISPREASRVGRFLSIASHTLTRCLPSHSNQPAALFSPVLVRLRCALHSMTTRRHARLRLASRALAFAAHQLVSRSRAGGVNAHVLSVLGRALLHLDERARSGMLSSAASSTTSTPPGTAPAPTRDRPGTHVGRLRWRSGGDSACRSRRKGVQRLRAAEGEPTARHGAFGRFRSRCG